VLLALLGAILLAACTQSVGTPEAPATNSGAFFPVPLSSSSASSSGSWAVVPMGHLQDPENTFWQLFFRPAGNASWTLATPPGVADNGGLVMTTGETGAETVGFEANQFLVLSPLAQTTDQGQDWNQGLVPAALSPDPDVLAVSPTGQSDAIDRSDGGTVLATTQGLDNWTTLITQRALATSAAGRTCNIQALTAVAFSPTGTPLLAANCTTPGVVGIFRAGPAGWQLVGPSVSTALADASVRVLRLVQDGSGIATLLSLHSSDGDQLLVAGSQSGQGAWSVSAPLSTTSSTLVASAVGSAGQFLVLTTGSDGALSLHETPPAVPGDAAPASWLTLPAPPTGTQGVVLGDTTPGSPRLDALAVDNSVLTDWQLTASGTWSKTQSLSVPIEYGSSS
jgi:hypothetical protein